MKPRFLLLLSLFGLAPLTLGAALLPLDSHYQQSLDGQWRFKLEQAGSANNDRPAKPPALVLPAHLEPFQTLDYREDAKWRDLPVPGNWEMAGISPATYWQPDNDIGLYRTWIVIPADWQGRRVLINFDGVQNGAEIYLNGQPVEVNEPAWDRKNYHEGGWDAFQVDLTPAVKFGASNLLAIRVYKNSPSANMDSGDYFFLGGIYREVTLFSVPQVHLESLAVRTKLLDAGRAEVRALVRASGGGGGAVALNLDGEASDKVLLDSDGKAEWVHVVDHPRLWSAEHPNLYRFSVELEDAQGKAAERINRRIGLREVSIKNGVFLVNGVPVKLEGICRHDLWPTVGTALTEAIWRKDLTLMKAANINAIRTSHYPYASRFYDLCDEMGFYVADEMAACWVPTDTDELTPRFAQHARELVSRDLNHPSVVIWAIGNENSKGKNDRVAADVIHAMDPTRPRLVSRQDVEEAGVDIDDRHYPRPEAYAKANADLPRRNTIPFICLEGPNVWEVRNGADYGCLDLWAQVMVRTWDVVWKGEHLPGSFLWEWRDRAVADPGPVHLYDFDPSTGINWIKTKGICDAFGNPRPDYYHVKMVYAQVVLKPGITLEPSSVSFEAENRFSFTNLSELSAHWRLLKGKRLVQDGVARLALAPLSQGRLTMPLSEADRKDADRLEIEFNHADGVNVATYSFPLVTAPSHLLATSASIPNSILFPKINLVTFESKGWQWAHRHPSQLATIQVTEAGAAARKPLSEAALAAMPLSRIHHLTADIVMAEDPSKERGQVEVDVSNGTFSYHLTWTSAPADVQELGWSFELPAACDHFSWNRQALWSWYPATHIGRPEGTATPDSALAPISRVTRPDVYDFNSTKYDCNWAELTDGSGVGLGVTFDASTREHCRGDFGSNSGYKLVVNRYSCPPRDISSSAVPDLYLAIKKGQSIEGTFRVGETEPRDLASGE